ncbi:hypothetical protein GQ54DRAFT_103017 [Martensiomyces pterosporus]|nr:hypothetical protein GQ54DRAFT_103017 [Martensiomyces pterosporus]
MTYVKEPFDPDKKSPSGYLDSHIPQDGAEPSAPSVMYMVPTRDLPPEYSESDPQAPPGAPPPFVGSSQGDLKVDKKNPKELVATKGFAFDRPIYIHTTGIACSGIIIEPDTNPNNQGTVVITAKLSSPTAGIEDRCEFTVHLNEHDEYDFHANLAWSFWNMMMVQCKFFVRVPSTINCVHPGIRGEIERGQIDLTSLANVNFGRLNLKTAHGNVSMTNVRGGDVKLATSNGKARAENVVASEKLEIRSCNGGMELENIRTQDLSATASNASINLRDVAVGRARVETSNASIDGRDIKGSEVDLRTSNASIDTIGVEAESLHIATKNARVEGMWKVKTLLDIYTTNGKIDGTIALADPQAPANIRLNTTNSQIRALLPADSFRGTVDARTSNGHATVEWANIQMPPPPMQNLVRDKAYRRVNVGEMGRMVHDFAAKTTNGGIDVRFA